eukprot:gene22459-biopygen7207
MERPIDSHRFPLIAHGLSRCERDVRWRVFLPGGLEAGPPAARPWPAADPPGLPPGHTHRRKMCCNFPCCSW